jgi:tetratricopeptide (TPR) repeat protein
LKKSKDDRLTPRIWIVFLTLSLFTLADVEIFISQRPFLSSWPVKIAAHLLLSACFIAFLFYFYKRNSDMRFLLLYGLFFVPLGPAGALTILLSLGLYLLYVKLTQPLGDLLISLMPPIEQNASEETYERILYHLDDFHPERVPIPFRDIMAFGTYKQKRMAIEKMLRYFRPEFAPVLRSGLDDKSNAVKVQAATALSYIDHKLFEENVQLKKLGEEDPRDMDALKAYAKHTQSYVFAEILDPDRRERMLEAAIQAYEAYLENVPEDEDSQLALAQLLYTQGNYSKSKKLLKRHLEIAFSPEAALLLMKVLYELKEYEELHAFAAKVKKNLGDHLLHDDLYDYVQLWSEGVPTHGKK